MRLLIAVILCLFLASCATAQYRLATINHYDLFTGYQDPRPYGRGAAQWHTWQFQDVPSGCRVWIDRLRLDFYALIEPGSDETSGLAMWAVHIRPPTKREWAPLIAVDESYRPVPGDDPAAAADAVLWAQPPVSSARPAYTPPTEYRIEALLGEDHTIWFRHAMFHVVGSGKVQLETTGQIYYEYQCKEKR